MRCYFVKDGRIVAHKELLGLPDQEAIEIGRSIFNESAGSYDGFEVWKDHRSIYRQGRVGRQKKSSRDSK
jgi:hypothetical protein